MTRSLLEKALELAAYENGSEKPETISAGRLVRLLIEASLMNSENKGAALRDYFLRYYGDGKLAQKREKDLQKFIKRLKKGKSGKTKESEIL